MPLNVGDKVVVFNPGTDWAFARKIDPVHVGDKVEVITLSDGTKLPLPRLTLNLDDYVFVLPEWDDDFDFEIPFRWGVLPLGMGVYTLEEVVSCDVVSDLQRTWADGLSNCWLIPVTGAKRGVYYNIVGFSGGHYTLSIDSSDWDTLEWDSPLWQIVPEYLPMTPDSLSPLTLCRYSPSGYGIYFWSVKAALNLNGAAGIKVNMKFRERGRVGFNFPDNGSIDQSSIAKSYIMAGGATAKCNINYPGFDTYAFPISGTPTSEIWFRVGLEGSSYGGNPKFMDLIMGVPTPYLPGCQTEGLAVGDKYVVVNKKTRTFVIDA